MDLLQQLTPGVTLLTPNRRLSAALLKKHQQHSIQQKQNCWQTPDILPFASWIERLWQLYCAENITETSILLTSNQEQILWEDIILHSKSDEDLLQITSAADLAKSAWGIVKQWQIDISHSSFDATQDTVTFQNWAKQFQDQCQQKNWIDSFSLIDKVIEKISAKKIILPQRIILKGFTELSPQQKKLLTLCEKSGVNVSYHETSTQNKTVQRISLADKDSEIHTMARWSKALLDQNPHTSIACVLLNLEDNREQVSRVFSETFRTEDQYSLNLTEIPYNISAGKTLVAYPIIHTAFQLLNLAKKNFSLSAFCSLLRSPFVGEAEQERLKRAMFEARLSGANLLTLSIDNLLNSKNEKYNMAHYCPSFAKRLKQFLETLGDQEKKLPVSQWVTQIIEFLKILGWPGERSLNSVEFQIIQNCWMPLLSQYAAFEHVLKPVTYESAVHYLMQIAANTVFQPQSPEAPVQILGMLEAVELSFDYLWIMGLDDSAWPSPAKPNPFIPTILQRTLNTPNANAERELVYCKKLTSQLIQSASHVILSHAHQNENSELRPSALIKNAEEISLNQLQLSAFLSPAQQIFATRDLDKLHDEKAPQVISQENMRGGASIFKLQAACPFKAFAEIRLHAAKLEAPTLGLRALDRGNIVHKALDLIWQELNDSDTLKSTSHEELKKIVQRCANNAISIVNEDHSEKTRYLSLELERLEKIIWNWLHLEKSRPYFKVILREQERTYKIGELHIKLRVDRIDELDNGDKFIIDYKTGKNNQVKNWFDERPEEPQLPLYCVTDPTNTIGISYAEIHPDSMTIKGISKYELHIPGINLLNEVKYTEAPSWEAQTQEWQKTLENLAQDFCQGNAKVDPKNQNETCRYCNLQAFCRIHEVSHSYD
jgi:ATP-dependent helicase/nuclease subunit B